MPVKFLTFIVQVLQDALIAHVVKRGCVLLQLVDQYLFVNTLRRFQGIKKHQLLTVWMVLVVIK